VVTDVREARREPELAVLSVMAHGRGEQGLRIAQGVVEAVEGLEEERVRLYVDLAMASVGEAARHALEELMRSGTYEYQSEFARKYVAQGREEGRQEGLQEGRQEGLQEGRQEGLQEGLQQGLQKGEKEALLEVLAARGVKVDAAARRRIQECTQLAQLKRWLRRAVTVQSVQELFARGPASKPTARGARKRGRARSPAPRSPRPR
jgi:flagellar biosynthesis/type III secretory pathway protein FliH